MITPTGKMIDALHKQAWLQDENTYDYELLSELLKVALDKTDRELFDVRVELREAEKEKQALEGQLQRLRDCL